MASKGDCCSNPLLNSDFVTCAGLCNGLFHIKCVGVNKQMLNTINTCANIHWYCHECNAENRNISAAILLDLWLIHCRRIWVKSSVNSRNKWKSSWTSSARRPAVSQITSASANGSGDNRTERICDNGSEIYQRIMNRKWKRLVVLLLF